MSPEQGASESAVIVITEKVITGSGRPELFSGGKVVALGAPLRSPKTISARSISVCCRRDHVLQRGVQKTH